MSDVPGDRLDRLDFDEALARIERAQAETRKFVAEQQKLIAEAEKFRRDRFLAPAIALAATLGAIAALAPAFNRFAGGHG